MSDIKIIPDYGESPRSFRRYWIVACLVIAVGVALYVGRQYAPPYAAQWKLVRDQNYCLTYQLPAATLVYTERPEQFGSGGLTEIQEPWTWIRSAGIRVPELQRIGATWPYPVFLHERVTPSGQRVLVNVSTHSGFELADGRRLVPVFCWSTEKLLSCAPGTKISQIESWAPSKFILTREQKFDVFAGQVDASDAAHFTIGYAIDGEQGVIDGRIVTDVSSGTEYVQWKQFNGPGKLMSGRESMKFKFK